MLSRIAAATAVLVVIASCGGGVDDSSGAGGNSSTTTTTATGTNASSGTGMGGNGATSSQVGSTTAATGTAAGGSTSFGTCFDAPPPGAAAPPPPPVYSGGSCPSLAPGVNNITSSGDNRDFILVVPSSYQPGPKVPLVFLWHWLGGSANNFLTVGEVQAAVDHFNVIAVIPNKSGNSNFAWPMDVASSNSDVQNDLTFFDDMLACVSEQYSINESCVSSAGVSAGALWTSAVLASERGEYLSSFVSLSGGTGGQFIKQWGGSAHKMPAMVLWGGDQDTCVVINFEDTSLDLESNLTADGHFFVECLHNCGHTAPPFEDSGSVSKLDALWQFVVDHPYWTTEGSSSYETSGLPANYPTWCGIGPGSATERTGACTGQMGCN